MEIKYVRASSINTYKDCQHKYFMEYVLNIPCRAGLKALLGTIAHHVLEVMAKAKKTGHYKLEDKYTDPDYLFDICWSRYIENDDHGFDVKPADKRFARKSVQKIVDSPFNPLKLNVLATEQRFQLPIERDDFKYEYYDLLTGECQKGHYEIWGTIDLITELDENTIEIIDWKTGKRRCWTSGVEKDHQYLMEKDIQLRMYDLAVHLLYPQYKDIIFTIHFMNDGGAYSVSFSEEERERTYEKLKESFHNIEKTQFPSRLKEVDPRSASWKCSKVCHFGKTISANGHSVCDTVYGSLVNHGVEETIKQVDKLRKAKKG